MKVKITKSKYSGLWYEDLIGKVYDVKEYNGNIWSVIDPQNCDEDGGIYKEDCEEVTMEETKEFKVGDEVTIIKAIGKNAESKKKYIGQSFVIASIDYRGYIGSDCTTGIYLYYPEELELVEPKEPVLTKAEALKLCIDGKTITPVDGVYLGCTVNFNGIDFIYNNDGYHDKAGGILTVDQWKLWTPPTPKPKFSIDQFVVDNDDGDYGRIVGIGYTGQQYIYDVSFGAYNDLKGNYDESQLSEVIQ